MRYWKPRKIPGDPVVTIVVATYLNDDPRRTASLTCLLYSLEAQTYKNWTAIVVHDGPIKSPIADRSNRQLSELSPRVRTVETPERLGHAGHPHRHKFAREAPGEFVGFANDDCYYMPTYLEWLLSELVSKEADLAHCDMVHSHQMWRPFSTAPIRGRIDVGGFLASKLLVTCTPWNDFSFSSDGHYVEALVKKARRVVKVPATLYVHN